LHPRRILLRPLLVFVTGNHFAAQLSKKTHNDFQSLL
jgi:hypothetical protein